MRCWVYCTSAGFLTLCSAYQFSAHKLLSAVACADEFPNVFSHKHRSIIQFSFCRLVLSSYAVGLRSPRENSRCHRRSPAVPRAIDIPSSAGKIWHQCKTLGPPTNNVDNKACFWCLSSSKMSYKGGTAPPKPRGDIYGHNMAYNFF